MLAPPGSMDEIEHKLAESINCNRARVQLLARFRVALIAVKTLCLTQIASVFPGEAQTGSHYKRIQRFLGGFDLDAGLLGVPASEACWCPSALCAGPGPNRLEVGSRAPEHPDASAGASGHRLSPALVCALQSRQH